MEKFCWVYFMHSWLSFLQKFFVDRHIGFRHMPGIQVESAPAGLIGHFQPELDHYL